MTKQGSLNTTGGDVAGPHIQRTQRVRPELARVARRVLDDLLALVPSVTVEQLISRERHHQVVGARHAWWWLVHEITGAPVCELAELLAPEHDPSGMRARVVGHPFVCLSAASQRLIRRIFEAAAVDSSRPRIEVAISRVEVTS